MEEEEEEEEERKREENIIKLNSILLINKCNSSILENKNAEKRIREYQH